VTSAGPFDRVDLSRDAFGEATDFIGRALHGSEMIVGTSGIGFMMFDARRAGSVTEIVLGMIVLGIPWYIVDAWVLAPIERATGRRWGLTQ